MVAAAVVPPSPSRGSCVKHINIAYKTEEMSYLFWPAGSRSAKPIPMQFEFGESFKAAAFLECCLVTWSNVISALSKNSHWRVRHEGITEKNAKGTFEGRCLLYPGDTAGVM